MADSTAEMAKTLYAADAHSHIDGKAKPALERINKGTGLVRVALVLVVGSDMVRRG